MSQHDSTRAPVALISGAARRIGAEVARRLHGDGHDVVIHHNSSSNAAQALATELNALRASSALAVQADLCAVSACGELVARALAWRARLDVLVNNASTFYPTPIDSADEEQWDDLMGTNLRAPYFLTQAAVPALREARGAVVNIVDIHAERPNRDHSIYCAAKAGLVALTRALALDLAPDVRVNAVAPGAILWPAGMGAAEQQRTLARVPMGRIGSTAEIARAVSYLIHPDSYVTGQILAVDGGLGLG